MAIKVDNYFSDTLYIISEDSFFVWVSSVRHEASVLLSIGGLLFGQRPNVVFAVGKLIDRARST